MISATTLAILASGIFFLSGLLTGVWKYRHMATADDATAPVYVDIAHRTSLMYSFAALVVAQFASFSPYSPTITLLATAAPLLFFAASILIYIIHGVLNDTDNQMQKPHRLGNKTVSGVFIHGFMWLLIVGEIGGFAVLFIGFCQTQL